MLSTKLWHFTIQRCKCNTNSRGWVMMVQQFHMRSEEIWVGMSVLILYEAACWFPDCPAAQTQNNHTETVSVKSLFDPLALASLIG